MKIVAGLGNPGRQYGATPHNLGFDVVDRLAQRWGLAFRPAERQRALTAEGRVAGRPALLAKPVTFMNLSGEAVASLVRQRDWEAEDLLVVVDDVNLPIGRMRLRNDGGHGGHNGLRSIVERLGHDRFARLRVGIRPKWEIEDLTAFVLSRLPALEKTQLADMADEAANAVEMWIEEGTKATAERFNAMKRFDETPPDTARNGPNTD